MKHRNIRMVAAGATALTMTCTMAFSAFAAEGTTITGVTYGDQYVETAATEDDTINSPSASSNIVAVELSDGTTVEAENGGVLTLVIDGDQYDILDYLEKGAVLEGDFSFEIGRASCRERV